MPFAHSALKFDSKEVMAITPIPASTAAPTSAAAPTSIAALTSKAASKIAKSIPTTHAPMVDEAIVAKVISSEVKEETIAKVVRKILKDIKSSESLEIKEAPTTTATPEVAETTMKPKKMPLSKEFRKL